MLNLLLMELLRTRRPSASPVSVSQVNRRAGCSRLNQRMGLTSARMPKRWQAERYVFFYKMIPDVDDLLTLSPEELAWSTS